MEFEWAEEKRFSTLEARGIDFLRICVNFSMEGRC